MSATVRRSWRRAVLAAILVTAVIAAVTVDIFSGSGSTVHSFGQAVRSGSLRLTPIRLECGKAFQALPKEAKEVAGYKHPPGQICTLPVLVENVGGVPTPPLIHGVLYIGDLQYGDGTTLPAYFPAEPPGFHLTMEMIFDVPKHEQPTKLALAGISPTKGASPWIYYLVPGTP
jgi:hypothetical protein